VNPFTGFILPGAGASGINIIDNDMQNPTVQQFNLGVERRCRGSVLRAWTGCTTAGTHFIIGRTVGDGVQPGRGRARPRGASSRASTRNTRACSSSSSAEQRASLPAAARPTR
jgi:hypothetical protein